MRQMCAEPAAVHRTFARCVLRAAFPSGPNPCPIYAAGGRARRPHRRRDGSAAQPPCRAHTPRLSQCGACAVSGAHAVQAVGTCGESTAPKEGCTCSGLADLPPAGGRAWLASRARTVAWSRRPGKLCTQQAQSVAHAHGYCVRVHRRTHTRTHSHASFHAQSRRPWSHALQLTNTELIISALTAARSVGCGWANKSSQWIGLSGVIAAPAQGLQLGTAPTLKEAQEQCDADAQCYLVFADLRGNARWALRFFRRRRRRVAWLGVRCSRMSPRLR